MQVLHYNRANRQVAILCNHQRSVPKSHSAQMEKLKTLVEELEAEKKKLQHRYELVKAGQPLPESESESEEEKKDEDDTPKKKKKVSLPTDRTRIKKAIQKLDERIKNRKVEIEQKDELKTIALGTSKINYMDPRITAAWCKKHDVRRPSDQRCLVVALRVGCCCGREADAQLCCATLRVFVLAGADREDLLQDPPRQVPLGHGRRCRLQVLGEGRKKAGERVRGRGKRERESVWVV